MSSSLLRLLWSQSKSTELSSTSQTILECWQVLSMQFFYWGYSTGLGSPGCASFYDLTATRWGRQLTQHFLRGSKLRHARLLSQIHTSGEQQGEESDSHSLTQKSLSVLASLLTPVLLDLWCRSVRLICSANTQGLSPESADIEQTRQRACCCSLDLL